MRRDFPELEHSVPDLPRIIDCRNFLVHVYFAIDYERLLGIAQKHVLDLLPVLESLCETFDPDYRGTEEAWKRDAPKQN